MNTGTNQKRILSYFATRKSKKLMENWLKLQSYYKNSLYEAGCDEAGRGPLAGPVYAAAVMLHPDRPIIGLNDSKN